MFKEVMKRGLRGLSYFVLISYVLSVIKSAETGTGVYYPVIQALQDQCSTQIGAVLLQIALAAIMGFVQGAATCCWDVENWSMARSTFTHFCIITPVMLVCSYICHWMPHSVRGFLSWTLMFIIVYVIIWFACYTFYRLSVKAINKELLNNGKES